MVTSTGDFEFETAKFGELNPSKDWHFPLPRIHWRPKVKSSKNARLSTRYVHKGSHRKADPARTSKGVTYRLFTIAVAVYHYYIVALVLKGSEEASYLLHAGNFFLAAAISSAAVWVYYLRKANKPRVVVSVDQVVYVTTEQARGGYGLGDTAEFDSDFRVIA